MRIVFEHNVFQLTDLVLGHENVKHVRLFIRVSARAFQTSNSSVHLLQDFLLQSHVVQLRDNPHLDVNVLRMLVIDRKGADRRIDQRIDHGADVKQEQAAAILKDLKCPFVINQNCYSIFDRTVEKNGLKDMTGNLKKGLITFSPLAQGQLTDRYLNGIPEDSRIRKDGRFLKESILTAERMEQIRKLNELAAQRGEKLADMALAWLLQKKEVTSVLIGASKTQQILDNIKAIHSAPFTEEELQKIDEYSL